MSNFWKKMQNDYKDAVNKERLKLEAETKELEALAESRKTLWDKLGTELDPLVSEAARNLYAKQKAEQDIELAMANAACHEFDYKLIELENKKSQLEIAMRIKTEEHTRCSEDLIELAAQNEALRSALESWVLGYPDLVDQKNRDALALPNISSEILQKRDTEVAQRVLDLVGLQWCHGDILKEIAKGR